MKIELKEIKVSKNKEKELKEKAINAKKKLLEDNDAKTDMTGWIDYPQEISEGLLNDIEACAKEVVKKCEVLVVIGVGGSYLGTKALLEALNPQRREYGDLKIVFAGYTLSASYTSYLLQYLKNKAFCINYVSKSGNTTEPAIAFRLFKELLKKQHKSFYKDWIYVTTDSFSGNALTEAKKEGYKTFSIPSNIGGRYSCFTSAVLFPLACKGIDIRSFIRGGIDSRRECLENDFDNNIALQYAYARHMCYASGKSVEALCMFSPRLESVIDWWKQLFAESEGKNKLGLLPIGMSYSTDLHSIGQFVQDGTPILFETIIEAKQTISGVIIESDDNDYDGLNYLANQDLHFINNQMMQATIDAHSKGSVPIIHISIDQIDTYTLGKIMYMFMFSCAVSANMLGVCPFDQPAVSEYKDRLKELLHNK